MKFSNNEFGVDIFIVGSVCVGAGCWAQWDTELMTCILPFLPHTALEGERFSYFCSAGEELWHREVKEFSQGHTASEYSSQDLN